LAGDDAHHTAAVAALASASDDELVLAATTRTEILVGPSRAGPERLQHALALIVADTVEADAIWTFDRRWATVRARVEILAGTTGT
jgi:hypothetical protein